MKKQIKQKLKNGEWYEQSIYQNILFILFLQGEGETGTVERLAWAKCEETYILLRVWIAYSPDHHLRF